VGKTATAHALGDVLATWFGRRVLLVDVDPQCSLTKACGVQDVDSRSMVEVLGGATWGQRSLDGVIRQVSASLDIAPANPLLAAVEQDLKMRIRRETVLKDALVTVAGDHGASLGDRRIDAAPYDVVIVDTPPSFGPLTYAALAAADGLLIPCRPEYLSLQSLQVFMRRLGDVRRHSNPLIEILGVLATFCDRRLNHHKAMLHMMRTAGYPLLDVTIGRSVRVSEASKEGQSVVSYAPTNERAIEYGVLGSIIDTWLHDALHSRTA